MRCECRFLCRVPAAERIEDSDEKEQHEQANENASHKIGALDESRLLRAKSQEGSDSSVEHG